MCSHKYLMLAVIGLTLTMLASAQTKPKPCCYPGVFSSDLSMLYLQTAMEGQPERRVLTETVVFFDKPNKRFAYNSTVKVLNSKDPELHQFQIQDYRKDVMYLIEDDICTKIPLEGDFPVENFCVPKEAVFNGAIKLGETLAVNRWLITDGKNTRIDFITTENECVPVTIGGVVEPKDWSMISQEYFNFKPTIDKPDKIFTPPASCNNAPILIMPHRVKKLPFGIQPVKF